jgi:hypothetical protein
MKSTKDIVNNKIDYDLSYTQYFQYNAKNPSFPDSIKYNLGQNIYEMILDCNFANQKCSFNYSSVDKSWIFTEFEKSYTLNFGTCFKFNSLLDLDNNQIPIKKVIKDGTNSELELLLYLREQNGIPYLNEDRGFVVFIENQSHVPSTFDNGIFLKTGTNTKIALKKVVTERLPFPYSDCRSEYPDDAIYDIYRENGYVYKSRDCFNLCIQMLIIDNCGCYSLLYDVHNESIPVCDFYSECLRDYCNPITMESLFKPLERSCFNTEANQFCVSYCPTECYSVSYDITPSYSDFPNPYYAERLKILTISKIFKSDWIINGEIPLDLMKNQLAKLSIFFSDLSYTFVTEKAKMEWVDFLANIGKLIHF